MRISFRIRTLKPWHISFLVLVVLVTAAFLTRNVVVFTFALVLSVLSLALWSMREHLFLVTRPPLIAIERACRVLELLDLVYDLQGTRLVVSKVDSRYVFLAVGPWTIFVVEPSPTTKEQRYIRDSMLKYQKQS